MPDPADIIRLTRDPLTLDGLVRELGHASTLADGAGSDPEAGALVTFSGIVTACTSRPTWSAVESPTG